MWKWLLGIVVAGWLGSSGCAPRGIAIPADGSTRSDARPEFLPTRRSFDAKNDVEPILGRSHLVWRRLTDARWGELVVLSLTDNQQRILPTAVSAFSFSGEWVVGLTARERPLFVWNNLVTGDTFELPLPADAMAVNSFSLHGERLVVSYTVDSEHDVARSWSLAARAWGLPFGDAMMARSPHADDASLVWLQNRDHAADHASIHWDLFARPLGSDSGAGQLLAPKGAGDYERIVGIDGGDVLLTTRTASTNALALRSLTTDQELVLADEPHTFVTLTAGADLDTAWVAYVAEAAGRSDLVVYRRADGSRFAVTVDPGTQSRSPSLCGDVLAFSDNRTGDFDIYTIDLNALAGEEMP